MKLPHAEHAIVEREKITEYLLNAAHPDNGGKSSFFFRLGFRSDDWLSLAAAFRRLAVRGEVANSLTSPHGQKYIVDEHIETPSGKTPLVRTVWIVDVGQNEPRLVTAYPQEK